MVRPAGTLRTLCLQKRRGIKRAYLRLADGANLRAADAIHYTSDNEQREAETAFPWLPPGLVIPLGVAAPSVDPGEIRPVRDRHDLHGHTVILYLSRLDPTKGWDALLPALAILREQTRSPWKLLVVGEGTSEYAFHLKKEVSRHKLDPHVSFAGGIYGHEKWAYLHASDLFVLPSHGESFGLAVIEAMSSGLPVVISRQIPTWKTIEAAGAGVGVSLRPECLAKALRQMIESPTLRKTQGDNARSEAHRNFSWQKAGKELLAAYHHLTTH